ncbi:MAG: hypothetical protein AABZ43_04055 [Planctomycetota bacterium]
MSYLQNKNVIRWLGIASFIYAIICLHGCAQLQTKESTLSPPHKKYTVTMPENGWEPIKLDKGDLALWHKQHHAMIAFISTNVDDKEVSLEMLNSQLFIGIKGKEILLNESTTVDNQNAIHTMLAGEMDNCKLKIDSYVIRAGNYIYDLVYWAPSDSFDYVKGDFENMVRSFKFTQ